MAIWVKRHGGVVEHYADMRTYEVIGGGLKLSTVIREAGAKCPECGYVHAGNVEHSVMLITSEQLEVTTSATIAHDVWGCSRRSPRATAEVIADLQQRRLQPGLDRAAKYVREKAQRAAAAEGPGSLGLSYLLNQMAIEIEALAHQPTYEDDHG